eukprot:CAMPEP_0118975010 /NCGR_PEP_ID=MMETSP1173-20130426/14310_1 /TAXON_ID=1034831 /ORGANISM="Rhizochromulina marina cf, Strain CCMP1243" /LENGTH=213 /DNA_ID=CAMNT_0006924831 /DNA_START=24 /DNA_END=665 /DNA_ORIENTATION=+
MIGDRFALLAADTALRRGAQVLVRDSTPIAHLAPRILVAGVGDAAHTEEFTSFISRNIALIDIVAGSSTPTASAVHFTRREVSRMLRSTPLQAEFLIAGLDSETRHSGVPRPELHWIDGTGATARVKYLAVGPAASMVTAVLDDLWEKDMSIDKAKEVLAVCLQQLSKRFALVPGSWECRVVDAKGSRVLCLDLGIGDDGSEEDDGGEGEDRQ